MQFKDIQQWSVQNGIATPVNPHNQQWFDFNKQKIDYRTDHAKFDQFASQHIYSCDAPDGVYGAERFGPVVWRFKSIYSKDWEIVDRKNMTHSNNSFSQFKLSMQSISEPLLCEQFLPFIHQEHPAEIKPQFGEWVSDEYLKSLPFHDKYFSNESWHPDAMDIKDMGQKAYDEAMAEYNKAESDVLFEGFRVSFETCDCGDGYGCSHGSWPYEILNDFEGVDMSWEDDGFL